MQRADVTSFQGVASLPVQHSLLTDSQVVLKWIVNPDLHLARFVKRRVDKILVVSLPEAWNYVNTSANPADVGTRERRVKHADAVNVWLNGPVFLLIEGIEPTAQDTGPTVRVVTVNEKSLIERDKSSFERLIESCPDLYTLKKRAAYQRWSRGHKARGQG